MGDERKRERFRALAIRGGCCVGWWITPNGVTGRWGRYVLTEDTWSIKLSFSLSLFPSHLLPAQLFLSFFVLVRWFEHTVWSQRTFFEITVWSLNWDEKQSSDIKTNTHTGHSKGQIWSFSPYWHCWRALSWHYLKSIQPEACSECLAVTLNTQGAILHDGKTERNSKWQPEGKVNYIFTNYCNYTPCIVNLS